MTIEGWCFVLFELQVSSGRFAKRCPLVEYNRYAKEQQHANVR